ncbi:hypothetical protein M6I34_06155 [Burkholderiaceae bacterium FT117]|uniref:hypothetical protein n=1 Tax=Zeimonas sediminis TaxID=2944268 RepID=UPI002342C1FA|nr:hypothetical protein [Zeimonas sediminis]MCM5570084.1 hypothetical protein [Zeimonas sediminis]
MSAIQPRCRSPASLASFSALASVAPLASAVDNSMQAATRFARSEDGRLKG